jgi:hypothetical protein
VLRSPKREFGLQYFTALVARALGADTGGAMKPMLVPCSDLARLSWDFLRIRGS